MNPPASILRCAAHVPRLRLPRAVIADATVWTRPPGRGAVLGARAVCNWDEDALTMGVEAGRACLAAAPAPRAVTFCSTTAPFADRDAAVMLAAALDLPEDVETSNAGLSQRAATRALTAALHRSDGAATLLAAADLRLTRAGSPEELTYGDAGAALLVGPADAGALATFVAGRSVASDFVDHYRMAGSDFDYALEERWVRDESLLKLIPRIVAEVLADAGVDAADVRHFVVPAGAAAARLAAACGLGAAARDARVLTECGNAGVALPLLLLMATLETAAPGELILMLGIGQGVDALLLRAADGVTAMGRPLADALARRCEEPSYVRYLAHRGLLDVDFGMRAERDQRTAHTVAFRKRSALAAFHGGRCSRCGTVQFPASRHCVNPECRAADTQLSHPLAGSSGRVKTFTEDWQAYCVRPPYVYGNVEFAEGGNLFMEFTDVEAGELEVDAAVRFVFRIKDEDRARHFRRYFWKATKA